jgi:hypothetical protein
MQNHGLALQMRLTLHPTLLAIATAAGTATCGAEAARDFTPEVIALYRVTACGDASSPEFDANASEEHCKELDMAIRHWREGFLAQAGPWFADLFKNGYPANVVYPFGGGDLLSLLAVYPDATEYTTLSLEGMGDPRPMLDLERGDFEDDAKAGEALSKKLADVRGVLVEQLKRAWNTTSQLSSESGKSGSGALPGVLAMTLVALEVHGYEPVLARFFTILADGTLHYLSQADVDAADQTGPPPRKPNENMLQMGAFSNVEITFRKRGDAKAPLKTFRHIAADLSDGALEKDPSTLIYLEKKGRIAAMTKAASYLLWHKSFTKIRDYLLAHMTLMVSDDTGIPPRYAKAAGFAQEVWGKFEGAHFIDRHVYIQEEFKQLWKSSSKGELAFPFGYPDNAGNGHLLFTYKEMPGVAHEKFY